jgi:hypothetical protein
VLLATALKLGGSVKGGEYLALLDSYLYFKDDFTDEFNRGVEKTSP